MKLIVGLGNPGEEYKYTRHNLGFLVVDELAKRLAIQIHKVECHAKTGKARWRGCPLLLAQPQTFMNRSGLAVQALANYYKISVSDLIIIYDDLSLPPGRLRIRGKGSAGGHNGIRSIIHYLRTDEFPRIRIGIGPVPEGWSGADYVLGAIPRDDELLGQSIERAAEAALCWVEDGIDAAMRAFNGT